MPFTLRNLPRGYGKRIVYRKSDFLRNGKNWRALDDSESPEYLVYYDSELDHYMEAVRLETKNLGNQITDYQTKKLTIKLFDDSELDYEFDQELFNAYNIPEKFTDKSELYLIGPVLPLNFLTVIEDSEGARIWKKIDEPGIDKGDFEIKGPTLDKITSIRSAEIYGAMENQIDKQFNSFKEEGKIYFVKAENFIAERDTPILKGKFKGYEGAVVSVEADSESYKILNFFGLIEFDSETLHVDSDIDSELIFHSRVVSADSEVFAFMITDEKVFQDVRIHYSRTSGDSERKFVDLSVLYESDFTIPNVPLNNDSEIVLTSFTTWHEDDEPWKVFNDSDNDGFKAALGVQSGMIGIYTDDLQRRYKLTRVIMENNLSTVANNRPREFKIERYSRDSEAWYLVHWESDFDGYTFNKQFSADSELFGDGFRIVVLSCQPDFDSDYNALEIKQLTFQTERIEYNVNRFGRGFFVEKADSEFFFLLNESETVFGFVAGAGGGGGGGDNGSGGWGGASANIDNLVLPPGIYSMKVGKGGDGAPNSQNVPQYIPPGGNGGDTILRDVTRGKNIILAEGGLGGFSSWRDPNNNQEVHADSEARYAEMVRSTVIVDSDYNMEYRALDGLAGGRGGGPGDIYGSQYGESRPVDGGYRQHIKTFVNSITFDDSERAFGSGGGGTSWNRLPLDNTGGENAGSPVSGTGKLWDPVPNCGGGGAGGDYYGRYINGVNTFDYWPGSNGGSGYAFLVFKSNK